MKEDQMNLNFGNLFSLKYCKSIAMGTIWVFWTTSSTHTQIIKNS